MKNTRVRVVGAEGATDAIRRVIDGWHATTKQPLRVVQPVRSSAPSALDVLGYLFLGLASSAQEPVGFEDGATRSLVQPVRKPLAFLDRLLKFRFAEEFIESQSIATVPAAQQMLTKLVLEVLVLCVFWCAKKAWRALAD